MLQPAMRSAGAGAWRFSISYFRKRIALSGPHVDCEPLVGWIPGSDIVRPGNGKRKDAHENSRPNISGRLLKATWAFIRSSR